MQCNGVRAVPEVITLSDSDEDDDSVREVCTSATTSATASVSILYERPLSPSAFNPPLVSAAHHNINSTARPTCGVDINGSSIHSSRLQSSKRFADDHQDVVAAKRLVVAEQAQRRPLQQPMQNATSTRTMFPYDPVITAPSTSNLRPRQASTERHAVTAASRHQISSIVPAKSGSTVPSAQQNSHQVSLQRQKIGEQPQPSLRQTSLRTVSPSQQISRSSAPQRPRVIPSPQPVAKPPQAQRRATSAQPTQKSRPVNQSSNFLNAYCYESFDPKAPPFEPQTFNARFKCCYERCRKILSNNVSLMFHVWTHVVCGRPSEAEEGSLSRLELASLCPQCLTVFPTPFAMQAHYVDVHNEKPSTATCNVCEITVERDSHLNLHGDDDAPYHCRKCRYRTSIRIHLLDHFVRFHSNTRTLLCPFCLLTFNVGNQYSSSSVVTCNPFVEHMRQHRTSKQIRCCSCALKFVRQSDRKMHKRDHTKRNPKWVSRSCFNSKHPRRKGRKVWHTLPVRRCVECAEVVCDLAEHTRQTRTCARCGFATGCDDEYIHHKAIRCTIKRDGFTRGRLLRCSVICAQCGRTSADAETIFPHIASCSGGCALIHEAEHEAADDISTAQEQQEVEHFALRKREMLQDRDWLPTVAKVAQEQSLPESVKKVRQLLTHVDDDDDFLNASKRKLVSANAGVLVKEVEDVMQCMEEFMLETSQDVASTFPD